MRKTKSIVSFTDKQYENALFLQSNIELKLYKNRLKIEPFFSILKDLSSQISAICPLIYTNTISVV